jgi:predicted Zn finger-like uncharacterized protein
MISGMLFTRCPNCETTFRITEVALQKADGQVRCGRCAHIFNAYKELQGREEGESAAERQDPAGSDTAGGAPRGEPDDADAVASLKTDAEADERGWPGRDSEATVSDETERPTDESAGDDLTADEIEAVLEELTEAATSKPEWMLGPLEADGGKHRRLWRTAALVATAALILQILHHYRAELAGTPVVGAALRQAYGFAGIELRPRLNVSQYELVDWKALAEPGANGQGNLVIESRVRNKGPGAQPYPYIHLRLLDRFEETVGSRVFAPAEYLPAPPADAAVMAAGFTADAELIIVDPGPDAYGFELDICVDLGKAYDCAADDVFD